MAGVRRGGKGDRREHEKKLALKKGFQGPLWPSNEILWLKHIEFCCAKNYLKFMRMTIGACISFSQDNPEETHSPKRDLSDEQQHVDDGMAVKENNPDHQQSEDWDLEELSNQNKLHKPYRDTKNRVTENNIEDDVTSPSSSVTTSSMDSREIRTRVKKSLDKKQRDMRRRKRGEASAVTRSRRENRDAVKHGAQSWYDGW